MPEDRYSAFLHNKIAVAKQTGFAVAETEMHPILKPFQRRAVAWAIAGGRRALFLQFGMGKTYIQLEIVRLLHQHEWGKYLIVCPLGVRQEFDSHSRTLGMT